MVSHDNPIALARTRICSDRSSIMARSTRPIDRSHIIDSAIVVSSNLPSRCAQGAMNLPGAGASVLLAILKFPGTSRYDPAKVRVRFRRSARSVSR